MVLKLRKNNKYKIQFCLALFLLLFLTGCTEIETVETTTKKIPKKVVVPVEKKVEKVEEKEVVEEVETEVIEKKAVETKESWVEIEDVMETIEEIIEPIEEKIIQPEIKNTIVSEEATTKKTVIPESTPSSNCHPSYSGCLRADASDYDCAGGSGNGPYYTGKVKVIGPDVFGLDRDHDGWGCE